ncbi:hypothetical protein SAMIE_1028030 [Sphingobium amiense]|uniref:AcrB/AcrD/AcrF family protein n=1 Tax=Sphingobium amiense TaxID=135719 RepID=A0A494WES1_9SPHN|nr:hypothetical protein [Sphingobium amiense]BBD99302.1 hypothetical protein SAMIE_1028030 [Sphingobium amiense]
MASSPAPEVRRPAVWALIAWLACCAVMLWLFRSDYAALGFKDPDDAMRLAQVRDWISRQAFWDVSQHRVNPPFGGPMHWSRIVDMPIAALILMLRLLLGGAGAELAALILTPLLLLGGLVAALFVAARRLAGERIALGAVVLLCATPTVLVQFTPLRIDHHGWQILLATVALAGALDSRARRGGIVAGLAVALWLQISSEALPYAALFGAIFALRHWVARDEAPRFVAYAVTLGGSALPLLVLLRGPDAALTRACDALSAAYVWPLALMAATVALAARVAGLHSAPRRLTVAMLGGGAALALFAITGGPCLTGDPFAALGPVAYRLWYLQVMEGRPVWEQSRALQGVILLPALLGMTSTLLAAHRAQGESRARWLVVAALLAGATAVSVMVMRALSVAHVFALPGIAWAILTAFRHAQADSRAWVRVPGSVALMLLTPVGLCSAWAAVTAKDDPGKSAVNCRAARVLAPLKGLPPATLFAPLDMGPDILVQTRHRVIGTAHHRNAAGITAVIDGFVDAPDAARGVIGRTGAAYVVACDGLTELRGYAKENPRGLAAALARGQAPEWLEPVPVKAPLRLYRIRQQ